MKGEKLSEVRDPKKVAEAALAQFKFASEILISAAVVDTMKVSAEFRETINAWAVQINAFVWSENLQLDNYTIEIVTPASWWQHFKLQVMPVWFKRLFPVKVERVVREIAIEKKALYPKLPLLLPDDAKGLGAYVIRLDIKDTPVEQ